MNKTANIAVRGLLIVPLIFALLVWSHAVAANHALLIGVGKYPKLKPDAQLEGPEYDVKALEKMLISKGFDQQNITVLLDEQAGRDAILGAMRNLEHTTRTGDFLFIFFSGHGTSGRDKDTQTLEIDPHTGALVPADFEIADPEAMMNRLIVGKRDIRPIIERLEKGRRLLVVFDSCHSGQTVRSLATIGKPKFLDTGPVKWGRHTKKKPPYPYKNTIYISAAADFEKARDIPQRDIPALIRTIDDKPHGAMTNALLYALDGGADGNGDQKISYRELHQFVRDKVVEKFPHTPQILYPESNRAMLDEPAFKTRSVPVLPQAPVLDNTIKVKLGSGTHNIRSSIEALSDIKIVDSQYDLNVTNQGTRGIARTLCIYLANGSLLAQVPADQVADRIRRQVKVRQLIKMDWPNQSFKVDVELVGNKAVLIEGDTVGFKVRPGSAAYIFLINIDSNGFINVLYPYDSSELEQIGAGKIVDLSGMGQVAPPNFGTEYIKAFAFRQRPGALESFMGAEFSPADPRFDQLMQMLSGLRNADVAQSTLMVKTEAGSVVGK